MESQPPSSSDGVFAVADESAPPLPVLEPPAKKHQAAGRKRDPVWDFTTVLADKRVVCNRCGTVIHRYGVAKVERVRAHFERKCSGVQAPTATLNAKETEEVRSNHLERSHSIMGADLKQHRVVIGSNYGNKSGAFKRKIAYWLYVTGQPFNNAESKLLLNALRVLRNDVVLPTKRELENELLDLEFIASKSRVSKILSGKRCCLIIEHWIGLEGCKMTTFGAICDGASYYLESKAALNHEIGGEVTADEVEAVLIKEKKTELCGIVTPTTSVFSKLTKGVIQKKHPRCIFFYGCICHALTLLLDDVSCIFPWLKTMQKSVVDLITIFHGNHNLQTQIFDSEFLHIANFPNSSSVCASLEDLLKYEKMLSTIVARRDFVNLSTPIEQEKLKRVQDFILGETFIRDVIKSLDILRPLQQHLKRFQEEQPSLSLVFPCYLELLSVYSSIKWVSKKEKALITSCITERFNAIYGVSHGVAYTLDPLYLGEALDDHKKQEVEDFIIRFCEHEGHSVDILTQLQKFKSKIVDLKETKKEFWQMVQSGSVAPLDFWMEHRSHFPYLHQLATAVYSLPIACVPYSPSYGDQSLEVHSRYDKLPPGQLAKLTHILCNSRKDAHEPLTSI
ncbi:putative Zinc finger, BED-type, ribonuclease H-like superfamily [Plasmopara halstedii]